MDRGMARYLGEALYLDRNDEVPPDKNKTPRRAIVFQLDLNGGVEGKSSRSTSSSGTISRL